MPDKESFLAIADAQTILDNSQDKNVIWVRTGCPHPGCYDCGFLIINYLAPNGKLYHNSKIIHGDNDIPAAMELMRNAVKKLERKIEKEAVNAR